MSMMIGSQLMNCWNLWNSFASCQPGNRSEYVVQRHQRRRPPPLLRHWHLHCIKVFPVLTSTR